MADETINTEVIYLARQTKPSTIELAKFVDGSKQPIEVYYLVGSSCSCFGYLRNPWCKHRKMVQRWEASGNPLHTIAYDDNKDWYYDLPGFTDGEPLLCVDSYSGLEAVLLK